ncbi:hypothetical protein LCGC14_1415600, partial [marine sediment metagenome]
MSSQKDKIREQLSAYLDGELTEAQAERVVRAAAQDPELAAELAALRRVSEMVGSLPREAAPAGMAEARKLLDGVAWCEDAYDTMV